MQKEILSASPDANLEVYAVWFNMYPGDDHSKWPRGILTDERVRQYWDSERVVGSWYGKHVTQGGDDHIEWDAWFLYDGEAEWTDAPKPMVGWGRTIAGTRKKLLEKITPLLAPEVLNSTSSSSLLLAPRTARVARPKSDGLLAPEVLNSTSSASLLLAPRTARVARPSTRPGCCRKEPERTMLPG